MIVIPKPLKCASKMDRYLCNGMTRKTFFIFLLFSSLIAGCSTNFKQDFPPDEQSFTSTPIETLTPEVEQDPKSTPDPSPTRLNGEASEEPEMINIVSSNVINEYPNSLTFEIVVESENQIQDVILFYRSRSNESLTMESVEFEQSDQIITSFVWDTSRFTIAPSSPILYFWEIVDELGNVITSPEEQVFYDDLRFPWKELSDQDLIVRWYEGNDGFGESIYDAARVSLDQMIFETNSELDFPLIVLIYANEVDFESWHYYVEDWVGGQAFTSIGITTQIIRPSSRLSWIEDVIPHEIAHLFFYQQIESNISSWPSWLNEGFAQYYEFNDKTQALERVQTAAFAGQLTPLRWLSGSFGHDREEVRLAYDQSLSTVLFIYDRWEIEGLQKLIESLRNGAGISQALIESFGLTFEEFEAEWRTWLGVPTTPEPSPTAFPTFEVIGGPTESPVQVTATPTQ